LISHYNVKVGHGKSHRQQLPAPPLMQRAPSNTAFDLPA
jgi:hypothetical protein